jgi:hypothetical protein
MRLQPEIPAISEAQSLAEQLFPVFAIGAPPDRPNPMTSSGLMGHFRQVDNRRMALFGKKGDFRPGTRVRAKHEVRRYYASFCHQAQSWRKPCRVVEKVE